jgi:hypothetical protein
MSQSQKVQPNTQTQAVSIYQNNPLGLPTQQEWNQIKEMCMMAVKSGMLPSSIKTAEAAAIIALKARELGIPLMVGFAHIVVINGKPAMSAELIQAQARKNLPGLIFNIVKADNTVCIVECQRPERGSKMFTGTFTIEDAKRAGLLGKDVWKNYPAAMLRARAITATLRVVCPDALMGISHTPEELGSDSMDGVIETTAREVPPAVPSSENVIDIKASAPVENTVVSDGPDEKEIKQKRISVWNQWKSAHGTEEGWKRYMKSIGVKSSHDLLLSQLYDIEHYISVQINSRPPQPVDPVAQVEDVKEISDANEDVADADAPAYDPNFDQA